jgi:hypothetical protein
MHEGAINASATNHVRTRRVRPVLNVKFNQSQLLFNLRVTLSRPSASPHVATRHVGCIVTMALSRTAMDAKSVSAMIHVRTRLARLGMNAKFNQSSAMLHPTVTTTRLSARRSVAT